MSFIVLTCLLKLSAVGAPVQKLHFDLSEEQVSELSVKWNLKNPTEAQFKAAACEHVSDLVESDRSVF